MGRFVRVRRRVVVYELNEVSWEILDEYVARRPRSTLATLLGETFQRTTINDDDVELMPWRTWPTFHCSAATADHNSFDQGQDPSTFRGVPLWDVADRAGRSVGLFGLLQTWPPRPFASGGFWVPDCFAPDAATVPPALAPFQRFNLNMTSTNLFAPTPTVPLGSVARSLPGLVRLGLRPRSVSFATTQLIRERIDRRFLERRSVVQALPAFDTYWALHRRTRPELSMFFTNHVAALLHRFLRDVVPDGPDPYEPDEVNGGFIITAMDIFDHHLRRMTRWLRNTEDAVLVIASSMSQGPLPRRSMPGTYVLDDARRLTSALALPASEREPCMYPRVTLRFADVNLADASSAPIRSVTTSDREPLFRDLRVEGRTLSFEISYRHDTQHLAQSARWRPLGGTAEVEGATSDLGVSVRGRSFGGDSGRHVPEGVLLALGRDIRSDQSRTAVDVLDAAPSILGLLGVDPDPSMKGTPDLFANAVSPAFRA